MKKGWCRLQADQVIRYASGQTERDRQRLLRMITRALDRAVLRGATEGVTQKHCPSCRCPAPRASGLERFARSLT